MTFEDNRYYWVREEDGSRFVAKLEDGEWFCCGVENPIDLDASQVICVIAEPAN